MSDEFGYSPSFLSTDDVIPKMSATTSKPSLVSADDILPKIALDKYKTVLVAFEGNLYDTNRVYDVNENYWDGKGQDSIPTLSIDDIRPTVEIRN